MDKPNNLQPGQKLFGRFQIIQPLGSGGGGTVYLAHDSHLHRQVAIKELSRNSDNYPYKAKRFKLEAELNAQLDKYSVVVNVIDFLKDDQENLYLIMSLAEKGSLHDLLNQRHRQPLELIEFYPIAYNILEAVKQIYNHPKRIVHRDIKPQNILLTGQRACLADFGFAQLIDEVSRSTTFSRQPGTALYMSPEQEDNVPLLDTRSDLYSVGLVFYEMLTGQPYKMVRPVKRASELNPKVTTQLNQVIERSLARSRDDRYQNAEEMIQDLVVAEKGGKIAPRIAITSEFNPIAVKSGNSRTGLLVALSVLFIAVIGGGLAFLLFSSNTPSVVAVLPTATAVPTVAVLPTATAVPTVAATPIPTATSAPTALPRPSPLPSAAPTASPTTAAAAAIAPTTATPVPPTATLDPIGDKSFALIGKYNVDKIGASTAKDGWIYLVVSVFIKNSGSTDLEVDPNLISLNTNLGNGYKRDCNGYYYSCRSPLKKPLPDNSLVLKPGSVISGEIAFQIPLDETPLNIEFNKQKVNL